MSSTLTWYPSALGTKTGTTAAALFADIVSVFNANASDANFSWQVASSQYVTSPYHIVLKRKDGSAGRILLINWVSSGSNNPTIVDATPTNNCLYGAYFPNGNVDTPSNINATSGTIMGNDTGAIKVWTAMSVGTVYGTGVQPFYFDSYDAVVLGLQTSGTQYVGGAGKLLVDANDVAYDAVFSYGTSSGGVFGVAGQSVIPWTQTKPQATSSTACIRTNYGSTDRAYFFAWAPSGTWAALSPSATDVLTDSSVSKAWFVPVQLLGLIKGEGFVLKLRQIAFGPGTASAFSIYTTSSGVAARQFNATSTGGVGTAWFTNFKL